MRIVLNLLLFCVCMSIKAQQQNMTEMKKAIDLMQVMYGVTFVYDSSLVTAKPQAFPLTGNSLRENLKEILDGTGIKWEIRDEYVLLFRPNNYTFSGYVCEDSGETLINVTVLDLNTMKGTLSNLICLTDRRWSPLRKIRGLSLRNCQRTSVRICRSTALPCVMT